MVLFFLYLKSSRHFSEQRYWLFSSIPTSLPSSMSQLHIVQYFIFTLLGEFAGLGTSATFGPGSVIPTSDKLVADTAWLPVDDWFFLWTRQNRIRHPLHFLSLF